MTEEEIDIVKEHILDDIESTMPDGLIRDDVFDCITMAIDDLKDHIRALQVMESEYESDTSDLIAQIKAIPWAKNINYLAMNLAGDWWAYEQEPLCDYAHWDIWKNMKGQKFAIYAIEIPKHPDWTQSLIRVNEREE